MNHTNRSRREFLKKNSKAGMGLLLSMSMPAFMGIPCLAYEVQEPIIDIHQHTNYGGRTDEHLLEHQRAMGVSMTVLQPAGRPLDYGSTYYGVGNGLQAKATGNEACYNFSKLHPGEFLFGANEVPDFPGAVAEIEKYLKLGAPIIGELKFGVECDSPEMQSIYKLAEKYEVPVLMHWQHNMYNRGFDRFHKMLKKYKRVNFLGHSQTWWANIDKNQTDQNNIYPKSKVMAGGLTDRLLSDYPNMYADLSAPSGLNAILRDEDHMREFMERHQDQIVFGSDCPDISGKGRACTGAQIIAGIRRLAPNRQIERKILYENSKRLLKL